MKEYILGNRNESDRLNYQSIHRNYLPSNEISALDLKLPKGGRALDAGCGTGLFSRYIAEVNSSNEIQIFAIDSSSQRIEEARAARENSIFPSIDFSVQDLRSIQVPDESIDLIVCRFVYQHIKDYCLEVSKELYRILKKGGRLFVIDSDGVLYNMDSEDEFLSSCLKKIRESSINFEGYVCKKIPRYLINSGFLQSDISITPKPMLFFDRQDREYENELWAMRFEQIETTVAPILGDVNYHAFTKLYTEELMNPSCFLYYSKFVFKAVKSIS